MEIRVIILVFLSFNCALFSQNKEGDSVRGTSDNKTVMGGDHQFFYVRNGDYIFKRDYKNNLLDSILFDNRYPNNNIKLVIQNGDPVIVSRGGGMVWKVKNDTFKRADKSYNHKMTNQSTVFTHNDTIMKFGGYGFWSRRDFFTYYSEVTKEWEYYPVNNSANSPPGVSNVNTIFSNDYFYFSGGFKSNPTSPLNEAKNDEVWRFDFKNKTWTNFGTAKFSSTPNEKKLDIGNGRQLVVKKLNATNEFNNSYFRSKVDEPLLRSYRAFIYDYKNNTISQLKDLNPFFGISGGLWGNNNKDNTFASEVLVANDSLYHFRKNQIYGMSLNSYLSTNLNNTGAVYVDTKDLFNKLTQFTGTGLFILFAIVLFLYSRNRKRPRLSETGFHFNRVHYPLSKNELMVLNLILYNKRVESKLILKKIYDPQLSVAQNNRKKIEAVESLNQKVSSIMGIKNFINSKKSLKDQRLLIYYSNFRSDFVL